VRRSYRHMKIARCDTCSRLRFCCPWSGAVLRSLLLCRECRAVYKRRFLKDWSEQSVTPASNPSS
jgi:hypothetical protein